MHAPMTRLSTVSSKRTCLSCGHNSHSHSHSHKDEPHSQPPLHHSHSTLIQTQTSFASNQFMNSPPHKKLFPRHSHAPQFSHQTPYPARNCTRRAKNPLQNLNQTSTTTTTLLTTSQPIQPHNIRNQQHKLSLPPSLSPQRLHSPPITQSNPRQSSLIHHTTHTTQIPTHSPPSENRNRHSQHTDSIPKKGELKTAKKQDGLSLSTPMLPRTLRKQKTTARKEENIPRR